MHNNHSTAPIPAPPDNLLAAVQAGTFSVQYESYKKEIAQQWFIWLNQQDRYSLLSIVEHYYKEVARLRPYVDVSAFPHTQFTGSVGSLLRATESTDLTTMPQDYQQLVDQLWQTPAADAKALLAEIGEKLQESEYLNTTTNPTLGMLLPNLAWDIVAALAHTKGCDAYAALAAQITVTSALCMQDALCAHADDRCLAWHALAWYTFHEKKLDIYHYQQKDLYAIITTQPVVAMSLALPSIISILFDVVDPHNPTITPPLAIPVQGPRTPYNVFRAWLPTAGCVIDIAEATALSVWEVAELLISEQATAKSDNHSAVELPSHLVD